ncbi:AAA family ATPase [Isoptericola croceus]|uniref:AAA family ATPase n=1 Tax=Isoptericola croceus TaxID=3031406 RepID=UPI0023F6D514|nr:AAA family ATPase [Isoptericola croceus]
MSKTRSPGNSETRVERVKLTDFRGVTGSLEMSFVKPKQGPVSTIIYGENGTGKSSAVDAVEWACQGSVGRSAKFDARSRPWLINAASSRESCSVEVALTDGTTVSRNALRNEEGGLDITAAQNRPEFSHSPMSLKRADILSFLDAAPERRGAIFMNHHFPGEDGRPATISEHESESADVVIAAKTRVRRAATVVAALVEVEPPHDMGQVRLMLNNDVYRGLAPRHRGHANLPRKLQEPANELVESLEALDAAKRRHRQVSQLSNRATQRARRTHEILGNVSDWLTLSFRTVTGAGHVEEVVAEAGRLGPMSLEIEVRVSRDLQGPPQRMLSEGYQDLIALLYFLAVARAAGAHGQAKVLILDDVLQSVDAGIRVRLMQLVLEEFSDWQLIVTVHDRLWREQLHSIFQLSGHMVKHVEIRGWSFGALPKVSYDAVDPNIATELENALTGGDAATVCGVAGRVLEQIADTLSWTLAISVQRRRGDRYTLEDLWPGVRKALSKTALHETVREVDTWRHLRNMVGAHYNSWATGAAWSDAENFGLAVLVLLEKVRCSSCGQWVESMGKSLRCRCGHLEV